MYGFFPNWNGLTALKKLSERDLSPSNLDRVFVSVHVLSQAETGSKEDAYTPSYCKLSRTGRTYLNL